MNYFLGVDIGTTSVKAIAFNGQGKILHKESIGYNMQHPQPDRSEQNPDEIIDAAIAVMNAVAAQMKSAPQFVSFSAAMHSLIGVDENGKPITPCIIWADNRSSTIAEALKKTAQGKSFYEKTGVPIHAMSPLSKLLWLKDNDNGTFTKAHKFIGLKEYLFFKLFNDYLVDTSVASATGLLNYKTLNWDQAVLNYIGIEASKLSTIVPVTHVVKYQSDNKLLHEYFNDVPFVIGASDGALANIGGNATDAKTLAVTIGTSGAVRLMTGKPATDKEMRTFCYHAIDKEYIIGGASNNGAVVVQWLKEELLQTQEGYQDLYNLAATVEAGSNKLIFLPYILGERAPIWDANARGVFFGLSATHTKPHLIRAGMEGVIYALYSIGKIIMAQHPIQAIHASGGFAKSELWLQILADVFSIKVVLNETEESSAWGAALVGAKALNIQLPKDDHQPKVYLPKAENKEVYKQQFIKFERLVNVLLNEF